MRALLAISVVSLGMLVAPADAAPKRGATAAKSGTKAKVAKRTLRPQTAPKTRIPPTKKGASARLAYGAAGELRQTRDVVGRRDEPLTLEERTAKTIEKLLRGPLRNALTGLYVADAWTGEPLFAINANDAMNPASNVKLISTATALELLGPDFRYPTRILGAAPENGVVKGDIYLLGSYDPTLTAVDLDELATSISVRGITAIDGDIVVGSDPTRDGIFRAVIPVEIVAGSPGAPPIVTPAFGADHVSVVVTAKTARTAMRRHRLTYSVQTTKSATGIPLITLTVGGTIGKGGSAVYTLSTRERTATAAYALRAALRTHNVTVSGDYKILELGDYIGDSVVTGSLPIELARHQSKPLSEIVARINKYSINWLADRVVMTATALARKTTPTMDGALDAMYSWLERNAKLGRKDLLIDTGSGLSYKTQITPTELVAIIRAAGGFMHAANATPLPTEPDATARAWLDSLSIAGDDGTLRHRVRGATARIRGKSGTLSTVIAMSGLLDIDPARPIAFSLVTNTDVPLRKAYVRGAHDKVLSVLCSYLAATQRPGNAATAPTQAASSSAEEPAAQSADVVEPGDDAEEKMPTDEALDAEAATSK